MSIFDHQKPCDTDPLTEAIRSRAYEKFQQRSTASGDPVTDWLEAETEVLQSAFEAADKPMIAGPSPGPGVPSTLAVAAVASGVDTPP